MNSYPHATSCEEYNVTCVYILVKKSVRIKQMLKNKDNIFQILATSYAIPRIFKGICVTEILNR